MIRGRMRIPAGRAIFGLVVAVLTLAVAPQGTSGGSPGGQAVFGPKDYVRARGKPVVVTDVFTVADPAAVYVLRIDNGGARRQYPRVSSAVVRLNGEVVLRPGDFAGQDDDDDDRDHDDRDDDREGHQGRVIRKRVTLRLQNTLSVELRGQPGSGFTLQIRGRAANAPPTAAGPDGRPRLDRAARRRQVERRQRRPADVRLVVRVQAAGQRRGAL